MPGYARDVSSSMDVTEATEFVKGTQAASRKAKLDTAGAVVAGVLSAALFSKKRKRR